MRKITIVSAIILFYLFIYIMLPSGYTVETVQEQKHSELPFRKGERLTYEVTYKRLKVGKSILTFHGQKELDNKKVYHITFSTKLAMITDVEELYAYLDTFLPLEVHRTIKRFRTFTTRIKEKYDQKNFKVDIRQKTKFRSKYFSIEKDSNIHNAILLTYYYRTKAAFNKDERFQINLPTADFEVIFKGKETIETPLGRFSAYAFISSPARFKFWLSIDEKRIPLKIENPSTLGYSLAIKSID